MAIAEAGGASTTHVGRASRALDALNFFLADVRGGLGPYLAIYLLTVRNWNEAEISTTLAGLIVVNAGYSAAFLTLAAIAGTGLALFWLAMPETWRPNEGPATGKWAQKTNLARAAE